MLNETQAGIEIEKDWITKSGLRAVVLVVMYGKRRLHRCGYVEVPPGHPLFGVGYSDPADAIPPEMIEGATLGKKSPILAMTAGVGALPGETIRRSPDVAFDVHGGLTYSGDGKKGCPVPSDGWWFGFDCNHYGDQQIDPYPGGPQLPRPYDGVRSQEYVEAECERLAQQIVSIRYISREAGIRNLELRLQAVENGCVVKRDGLWRIASWGNSFPDRGRFNTLQDALDYLDQTGLLDMSGRKQ